MDGSFGLDPPESYRPRERTGALTTERVQASLDSPRMADLEIKLRCTNCRAYREFEREPEGEAVRCAVCGKRHSTDSLHAVEPGEEPSFGE